MERRFLVCFFGIKKDGKDIRAGLSYAIGAESEVEDGILGIISENLRDDWITCNYQVICEIPDGCNIELLPFGINISEVIENAPNT